MGLATVFLVVMMDLVGFGIVLPLLPFYAQTFNASPILIGCLYGVYSLAQFIASPMWGALSDRVGRRPVMIASTLGSSLSYVLFAFSHSLALLFVSRLVAGIMGGNIAAAQAYVADVTKPEDRAKGMGLIGAAFGIGFVAGPALSGALLALFPGKYAIPGIVAASLSFTSFFLVMTKLPEPARTSSVPERPSIFQKKFWATLRGRTALKSGVSPTRPALLPVLLFFALFLSFSQSSIYSTFPLFCESKLGLSPAQIGAQYALMGVVAILVQGGLIRILAKRFSEKSLLLLGWSLLAVGLAAIPITRGVFGLAWAIGIMAAGGSLCIPTLSSLVSKEAEADAVGRTMGVSQSLAGLGRVLGPVWGGWLYSHSFRAPFWATAVIAAGMLAAGPRLCAQPGKSRPRETVPGPE